MENNGVKGALDRLLNDNFIRNDDDNINDLKRFLLDFIYEHFEGIENLNKVIEAQKNNLTDSHMIGLYNGLVTAKAIILNNNDNIKLADNTIHPYKFEDLKVGMRIYDKKADWIYKIRAIDSESSIFVDNAYLGYCSLAFEENRFYPVQMANLES